MQWHKFNNAHNFAEILQKVKKLGSCVIPGCRFQICNHILHIDNIFAYIRVQYVINSLIN